MIAALKVVAAGGTYVPPEALEEAAGKVQRPPGGAVDPTDRQTGSQAAPKR
jgi:hypothetical protein